MRKFLTLALCAATAFTVAQAQPATSATGTVGGYGAPISLANARKLAAAASAEAERMGVTVAVAITDPAGGLVYLEKHDLAMAGGVTVAWAKARSAALFKRPTKAFEDSLATGGAGLRVLGLEGAVPVEGGLPILSDGKVIGAIGVSGASAAQDGAAARAGLDSAR